MGLFDKFRNKSFEEVLGTIDDPTDDAAPVSDDAAILDATESETVPSAQPPPK